MKKWNFEEYKSIINQLPEKNKYEKKDLLTKDFLIKKKNDIEIYYAPHNEYINKRAKIVVIGICPGWRQTEIAYRIAIKECHNNSDNETILYKAKVAARFAGSMRDNLIKMLDGIALNNCLSISSCSKLFQENDEYLHTTSLIPFPVFNNSENYNGYSPSLNNVLFRELIDSHFMEEIKCFNNVIVIPLGTVVEKTVVDLMRNYQSGNVNILRGLPHPSSANGNRRKQFEQNKNDLLFQVSSYGELV